jgi:hypothetical protein
MSNSMATNELTYKALPYIREIANEHDDVILGELGIKMKRNGDVHCKCPIHGGDNPTGFSYKSSKKVWKCWTHHCHETYGSDLIGLIQGVRECSIMEAMEFVYSLIGDIEFQGSPDVKRLIRQHAKQEVKYFDNSFFSDKDLHTPYFLSRGYSSDVLKLFQAFRFKNREYFPITTDDDKIMGFTGRTTINDPTQAKWKIYPHDIPKSDTLFGLNITKEEIRNKKVAIMVEGVPATINLFQNNVTNVVGTLGTFISQEQIKLLVKYGAHKIILAYDPDEPGILASRKMQEKLELYFKVENISDIIPCDPGKMSPDEVRKYFG